MGGAAGHRGINPLSELSCIFPMRQLPLALLAAALPLLHAAAQDLKAYQNYDTRILTSGKPISLRM